MGNRVYVTFISEKTSDTFYFHWNGGLDTWLPLAKVIFDHDVKATLDALKFIKTGLGLKTEPVDASKDSCEENGHYFLDLTAKSFTRKYLSNGYRGEPRSLVITDLKEAFETLLRTSIPIEWQGPIRRGYWDGILNAGNAFFEKKDG